VNLVSVCNIVVIFPHIHAGDGIPVDADEVAAQIEKERKKHLDLLTKLFPEDRDAG